MAELERRDAALRSAVDRLFATGYQVADDEYRQLRNSVDEARAQAEIAGFRFDRHRRAEHARAASDRPAS